jgi:23S rRNA pseudouridine1911/1915/1917 synthase
MGSLQANSIDRRWVLRGGEAGLRLDAFLDAKLPFLSRRELAEAIATGLFAVNGKVARKGARLQEGDIVEYGGSSVLLIDAPSANFELDIPVVYEDASILALNKPAGMDCHGFSGRHYATVANFLVARWPKLARVGKSRWEPGLVHRIDRDTSGLVLIAKTQTVFDELRGQFRRRAVRKIYLALVQGAAPASGTIAMPLAHDSSDRRKMRVVSAPEKERARVWRAVTRYDRISERRGASLLRVEMQTGVTHQIRAHLALAGHPIVGDVLYGSEETFGLTRHFLHAAELCFEHPVSRRAVVLRAPLAYELKLVLERLKFPDGDWMR